MKTLSEQLANRLRPHLPGGVPIVLTRPPQPELGDFSLALFDHARAAGGVNPVELARQVADALAVTAPITAVSATGPYLNLTVDVAALAAETLQQKKTKTPLRGTVMLDVFQANPLKAFHIGHLRNAVLGESIRRLLLRAGYRVKTYVYSGDVGIHIARWLWYFQNYYRGTVPKKDFTTWAGNLYAAACARAEEEPRFAEEVAEYNRWLDQRDRRIVPVWKKMTAASYAASWKTAAELGCHVDYSFPESICEAPGKKCVQAAIAAGRVYQDQGAWVVDLRARNLGVFIVLKSDGTTIYQTKDLGLGMLRRRKVKHYDQCLMVVGSEQEYYFRQLFATFEELGHPDAGVCEHIPHGLVSLKEGKMASRLGNVITYDELRNRATEKVLATITEKNPSLRRRQQVARTVALGALKFAMLKIDRVKNIAFDWDEALSFEGSTGPYLLYTYARLRSVARKAARALPRHRGAVDYGLLVEPEARAVLRTLADFSDAVARATADHQPSLLAQYLLDLAAAGNYFYHQVKVIDVGNPAASRARLALSEAIARTLHDGLELLGIDTVEEM